MRIALVHDYLIQDGGAERVLLALHKRFPEAPIYTLFHHPDRLDPALKTADIRSSHLERYLLHPRGYQLLLPFMAEAIESLDFSGFDLVIGSSSNFAKGAIVPPETPFLCYMHTPTRFLWEERHHYLGGLGWSRLGQAFMRPFLHRLRLWDRLSAERPDHLLTNSLTSKQRIKRYYQREARVVYPPVDLASIPQKRDVSREYWLAGGRFVPYKRLDLVIRAANELEAPLKIFGTGPLRHELRRIAGKTVEFLGKVSEKEKWKLLAGAKGFLMPQVEDFGITAIEAAATGTPVLAYASGGAKEILTPETGLLFPEQSVAGVVKAMRSFDERLFSPDSVRASVERFDTPYFYEAIDVAIDTLTKSV